MLKLFNIVLFYCLLVLLMGIVPWLKTGLSRLDGKFVLDFVWLDGMVVVCEIHRGSKMIRDLP